MTAAPTQVSEAEARQYGADKYRGYGGSSQGQDFGGYGTGPLTGTGTVR